jgi:hypothetical protein
VFAPTIENRCTYYSLLIRLLDCKIEKDAEQNIWAEEALHLFALGEELTVFESRTLIGTYESGIRAQRMARLVTETKDMRKKIGQIRSRMQATSNIRPPRGTEISIRAASRKYGIGYSTVVHWRDRGYVGLVNLGIDESDVFKVTQTPLPRGSHRGRPVRQFGRAEAKRCVLKPPDEVGVDLQRGFSPRKREFHVTSPPFSGGVTVQVDRVPQREPRLVSGQVAIGLDVMTPRHGTRQRVSGGTPDVVCGVWGFWPLGSG